MTDHPVLNTNEIIEQKSEKKQKTNDLIDKLKNENPESYRHIIALIKIVLQNKEV